MKLMIIQEVPTPSKNGGDCHARDQTYESDNPKEREGER
jgi:hypothetical protein